VTAVLQSTYKYTYKFPSLTQAEFTVEGPGLLGCLTLYHWVSGFWWF